LLDLAPQIGARESLDFHAMTASISPFSLTGGLPWEDLLDSSSTSAHSKHNSPAVEFLPGRSSQCESFGIGRRNIEIIRQVSIGNVRDFLFENLAGLVQAVPVDDGIAVVGEKIGRG
jgi:hypothetical protein